MSLDIFNFFHLLLFVASIFFLFCRRWSWVWFWNFGTSKTKRLLLFIFLAAKRYCLRWQVWSWLCICILFWVFFYFHCHWNSKLFLFFGWSLFLIYDLLYSLGSIIIANFHCFFLLSLITFMIILWYGYFLWTLILRFWLLHFLLPFRFVMETI